LRGSLADTGIMAATLVLWSTPSFFLALLLLFFGSAILGLPVSGLSTPGAEYTSFADQLSDLLTHAALPVLSLALVLCAQYVFVTRGALQDVLGEDYILLAKAKGMTERGVLLHHALRNALLPITALIALNLGFVVAGAIQVETVYAWPGVGRLIVQSLATRDYPVLQGAFLLLGASVIGANLLADTAYAWLDPRLRR